MSAPVPRRQIEAAANMCLVVRILLRAFTAAGRREQYPSDHVPVAWLYVFMHDAEVDVCMSGYVRSRVIAMLEIVGFN